MANSIAAPGAGEGDEGRADIVAEKMLLGALMLGESDSVHQAFSIVSTEDFALAKHAELFAAFQSLTEAHRLIDVITVTDELKRRGQLQQIGGVVYLFRLADSLPDLSVSVTSLAQQIRRNAEFRRHGESSF